VIVEFPVAVELPTVNVRTLEVVEDAGLNEAVTPLGSPDTANDTLPVKGLMSFTAIVSVPLAPGAIETVDAEGVSVNPPVLGGVTVRVMGIETGVSVPEVPVTVIVEFPAAAELPTVRVITLEVVEDAGLNEAVTPLGRPDAVKDTLPVNGLMSFTAIVSVPLELSAIEIVEAEGVSVKPPVGEVTVSVKVAVTGVSAPEVPVTVIVEVPAAAELPTARVRTLEVVDDVGLNAAVTPLGSPDTAKDTLPVKGLISFTAIVSVPLELWAIETVDAEGVSVNPPVPETTLSVNEVGAVMLPEVPVTVTVYAPVAVELPTVSVRTLEVVDDVGLKAEVTPLGSPDALKETVPVNPPKSVTVMVSVPLVPWVTDRLFAEGASEKPTPGTVTVTVTEFVTVPSIPTILMG
jgi:hypothetical protein